MRVGQVDLHVVFPDVRVNPREDLPLRVREDHVLVDDEEPVVSSKRGAGFGDGFRVEVGPFGVVRLLEPGDGFAVQIFSPDLKSGAFVLSDDDLGGPFDGLVLALPVELSLLFGLDGNPMGNSLVLFHQ